MNKEMATKQLMNALFETICVLPSKGIHFRPSPSQIGGRSELNADAQDFFCEGATKLTHLSYNSPRFEGYNLSPPLMYTLSALPNPGYRKHIFEKT